jgi:hypothetical protein
MPQMIRYRDRDKGGGIKLGNPKNQSHGLVIDKKSHLRLLLFTNRIVWDKSRFDVDLHAPRVTGSVIES